MIVIFLDFDGVLNSENSFMYNRLINPDPKSFVANPNPLSVTLFDYFLFITNSNIVVSSSWRSSSIDNTKKALREEFGLKRVDRVIDQTPRLRGQVARGTEIQHWLDRNKVDNYVILDDDSDMLNSQKPHFVQTKFKHGFTVDDMHKALNILGFDDGEARIFKLEEAIDDFRAGKDYYK